MVLTIDRTPAVAALLSLAVVLSGCQSTPMVADSDDPAPGETEEQPVAPDDPAPRETPEQADADAAVKAAEAAVEAAAARDVSDFVSRARTAAGRAAAAAAAEGDLDIAAALRLQAVLAEVRGEMAAVLLALDAAAGDFADADEALLGEVRSLVAEARTALDAAEAAVEADGTAEELTLFETFLSRAEGSLADVEAWIAARTGETAAAVGDARRAVAAQTARAEEAVAMSGAADVVAGVAGVIERAADVRGEGNSWQFHGSDAESGSGAAAISLSYDAGDLINLVVPYRGENGELEFHFGNFPVQGQIHDDPTVYTGRTIDTALRDGATTRVSTIEGSLGAGWQGLEAEQSYGDAGTLTVSFFTDAAGSDLPGKPHVGRDGGFDRDLVLNGVPDVPADRDYIFVLVPQEGLPGSLDGVNGTFACAPAVYFFCGLVSSRNDPRAFFPDAYDPIVFTPDGGGETEEIAAGQSAPVAASDWLALGYWLYMPKDPSDAGAFDFGVFASGGDPYPGNDLAGLTGTASYSGKAAGMYTQPSESGTDIGTFSANVELTADFGDAAATGTIGGRVFDFALENGGTPALTELRLGTPSDGTTNIFPGQGGNTGPLAGGWIVGDGPGSGPGDDGWWGSWSGKLYGTGADLPTSVAGTFGAANAAGDSEYAGAFGAHRQNQ